MYKFTLINQKDTIENKTNEIRNKRGNRLEKDSGKTLTAWGLYWVLGCHNLTLATTDSVLKRPTITCWLGISSNRQCCNVKVERHVNIKS